MLQVHPWLVLKDITIGLQFHSKKIPGKCASEKRNVEEVRQKIKVSNHSATRLLRNLADTKCTQSQSVFTIRCYGDHAELPTGTWETRWMSDYFVMACSPLTPQPPATIATARPSISSGNIGKWLSEIFFGWKNYSNHKLCLIGRRKECEQTSYLELKMVAILKMRLWYRNTLYRI